MSDNDHFDDFLGLRGLELRGVRLLVFAGVSGSGKSTAMRFLEREHPQFRGMRGAALSPESAPDALGDSRRFVLVEEVHRPRELKAVAQLLAAGTHGGSRVAPAAGVVRRRSASPGAAASSRRTATQPRSPAT